MIQARVQRYPRQPLTTCLSLLLHKVGAILISTSQGPEESMSELVQSTYNSAWHKYMPTFVL